MDADAIAAWVYGQTLSCESEPPGPAALLRRLLGTDALRFVDGPTRIERMTDRFTVDVARGLAPEELCQTLADALARIVLVMIDATVDDDAAERIACALVMPRCALLCAVKAYGPRVEALAAAFVVPPALVRRRMRALGVRLASGEYQSVRQLRTAG